MQRKPVDNSEINLVKREKPLIRTMGIDPGFATMGMALLELEAGSKPKALYLRVATTEKRAGNRKAVIETRVTVDDQRRLTDLWEHLETAFGEFPGRPSYVGIEAYRPFSGRGGGNAWKSAVGYGLVSGWARAKGIPVMVFLPDDLKRAFTLKRDSSKKEVEDALCKKILFLREILDGVPKAQQEHAADAAGHAYLAMVEMSKYLATMFQMGAL